MRWTVGTQARVFLTINQGTDEEAQIWFTRDDAYGIGIELVHQVNASAVGDPETGGSTDPT